MFKTFFIIKAVESAGIKFSDLRGSGVSLRSQKMKLPANIGQKKAKALEQTIQEFKVGKYITTSQFHDERAKNVIILFRSCSSADRGNIKCIQ